mmetsp:Transcript_31310/g.23270  ORF Transcript_31310/g.23270 Transcript_31310/m.23270 type:complete len:120 (+) Transcript_31310:121-480(+)
MGHKRVICSVSVELSQDHLQLMNLAEQNGGYVTFTLAKQKFGQDFASKERFDRAIEKLIADGIVWVDSQPLADPNSKEGVIANNDADRGTVYWFPSVMESMIKGQEELDEINLIKKEGA